jgi:hypothetical protein
MFGSLNRYVVAGPGLLDIERRAASRRDMLQVATVAERDAAARATEEEK